MAFGQTIIKGNSLPSFCSLETENKLLVCMGQKLKYGHRGSESSDCEKQHGNFLEKPLVLFKSEIK